MEQNGKGRIGLSDAAFLIYYRIVLCYCRNQLFSSSISSIYSLVLLRRGTLCCPPNFPFVPASHGIGLCGQQSPPEVAGQCSSVVLLHNRNSLLSVYHPVFGKILYTVRCLYKLNQPLVTAFSIGIHKYRSSRIIGNQCSGSLASPCQTFFRVIHNQFFTESIDEMLGTSGDDEFIWILCVNFTVSPII